MDFSFFRLTRQSCVSANDILRISVKIRITALLSGGCQFSVSNSLMNNNQYQWHILKEELAYFVHIKKNCEECLEKKKLYKAQYLEEE